MKKSKFLGAFFVIFFIASGVFAQSYYDSDVIPPSLLSSPYKINSSEWQNDVTEIKKRQKSYDQNEIKKALDERDLKPEIIIKYVDNSLTRKAYPKLYNLIDRTFITSKAVNDSAKNYWNTKRPYLVDKEIKALIKPHNNQSYPSGHTSLSYVTAHLLVLLIPEKRDQFYNRAAEIANHRVLVGMHYPKDVEGGKEMALLIVGALLENDQFKKDFSATKAELKDSFSDI